MKYIKDSLIPKPSAVNPINIVVSMIVIVLLLLLFVFGYIYLRKVKY